MRRPLVLSAVMLALGALARADEGRIPVLSLPGPPYTLSQPGHYILTQSIGLTTGAPIVIQSAGVTLDLGGNTVTGPSSFIAPTITVFVTSGTQEITIKNGRVFGGNGVSVGNASARVRIEGLDISASLGGITGSVEQAEVLDCRIHDLASTAGSGGTAISLQAHGGRIVGNLIQNIPGYGISLLGFGAGEIRRNIVRNYGGLPGLNAAGIYLEDISLESGSSNGAVIADNTLSSLPSGVDDDGIRTYGAGATFITGNNASRNGRIGIHLVGSENRLERNVTNRNGNDGIQFGLAQARNHLEGNQSQGNQGCGLDFNLAPNIFRNNILGNNTGGNICSVAGVNAGGNYCDLALCP